MLKNGEPWYDTEGRPIHAHGGHMLRDRDGYFYWYGENRLGAAYVSVYRSKNLTDWEFRNHVLTVDSKTEETRVKARMDLFTEASGDELPRPAGEEAVNPVIRHNGRLLRKVNIERPKVLFCEKTQKYVMWAHFENGLDYRQAACLVATCDTPDGDFTYHGAFNPYGEMSRDCTLFQDDDGTAYFLSASRHNFDLHIYRLASDYLNVSRMVNRVFQGESREAPAVYKRNGVYYLLSSFCTGWWPNQGKWSRADSMEGDWEVLENFGDETTFRSQPAFVLQKDGTDYYVGDRWGGAGEAYFQSTYVILPIGWRDGAPFITDSETAPF